MIREERREDREDEYTRVRDSRP